MMINRYRSSLMASTLFVSATLVAGAATAQTADPASNPKTGIQSTNPNAPSAGVSSSEAAPPVGENSQGDIVVTGTLISNPNLISASPVTVIGQETIALRQINNAEAILRDLPGVVPSIGSSVNNGNGGASFVDLRGLGSFRNVVLLDGQRITPSGLAGRVDLNNIPLALVERVDVLTGGAATTYGADAVSGVVNFITRSDFSGIEAQFSNEITEKGDGNYVRGDITVGANFDDGRGNAVFSIGYQQADPVYQGARDFSQLSLNSYTPNNLALSGSGTSVPATFSGTRPIDPATGQPSTVATVLNGGNRQLNAAGQAVAAYAPYNFAPFNVFRTPFERFNIYGAGKYEISDSLEVYTRGLFSKNTVQTIIAPSGAFATSVTIPLSNPYLPAALRNQFCAFNVAPVVNGVQTGYVPRFTPAQCTAAATATSPTDPNFRTVTVNLSRRTSEVGPRIGNYVTTIFDYKAGFRVGITDSIKLDVSGAYGESENSATQQNYTLNSRFRSAVYATSTTSCLAGAPNGASLTAGTGCVPVNVFGPEGSITAAQIPYLTAESTTTVRTSLAQARALLTGNVPITSPFAEDAVGFAAGAEFRKYRASQRADSLAQAGDLGGAGAASPNIDGGYEVREAYGELIVPLVADKPFFRVLTLEGGYRYSDYKVFAPTSPSYSTQTYKGAITWEPIEGVKFRGSYQHAVRAPNISELFSPVITGLTNLGTDPCAGTAPVTNATLRAVCLAQGAPASTIGSIANPTAGQANVTTGGNINLRPEKSNSYVGGIVLQPRGIVPGLTLTADYYHIKVTGAVSSFTPGDIIANCFGTNNSLANVNNPACALIRRSPVTGQLDGDQAVTQGLITNISNLGTLLTDGIDATISYRRDLGFAKLNLSAQGNWTNRSRFLSTPGAINRECVGYYSVNCASIQPKFQWSVRGTFTRGAFDLSLLWRHIDSVKHEPLDSVAGGAYFSGVVTPLGGGTYNFERIKAFNYLDLATRVGVSDNVDLTLTVTNLLDKDPPIVGSTAGSTAYNSGNTYPSSYDTLGRRYTVGARFKF